MHTHRLTTLDGFVILDLGDGATCTGAVRRAPRVLESGATWLARSLTYTYASLGMRRGGASAGINAEGAEGAEAQAAFVEEVRPLVAEGRFLPDAGKGVDPAALAPLADLDPRVAVPGERRDHLVAVGALAAAEQAVGGLDRQRVAIEGFSPAAAPLAARLAERGARIVAVSTPAGTLDRPEGINVAELVEGRVAPPADAPGAEAVFATECDVVFTGSRMGVLDHEVAPQVVASAVVPIGPIPVTTKALVMLQRAGIAVLPDFVVLAGPVQAAWAGAGHPDEELAARAAQTVQDVLAEVAGHDGGPLLGACERAEAFLATWLDELPFGRPLPG